MNNLIHIPVAFRHGARLPVGIDDPGAIHRAIATICSPDGDLLASDIIEAASDPASPMHAAFTWDDLEAADKQRMREAFYLAGSLIDAKTGEPVYVSRYKETNNPTDAGRIRINVRLLPVTATERSASHPTSFVVRSVPARDRLPALIDVPSEVVDHTPDEERSLAVFCRWVEAHKHEPLVLRAALRVLYSAL